MPTLYRSNADSKKQQLYAHIRQQKILKIASYAWQIKVAVRKMNL